MNANELADNQLTHVIGENNNGEEVVITLRKPLYPESFVRQQQAEIEALKAGKIRAYDNGVEDGRKPNTHPANPYQSITNTKIEPTVVSYTHPVNTCKHGVDDGACKECYIKEQEK